MHVKNILKFIKSFKNIPKQVTFTKVCTKTILIGYQKNIA